MENKTNRLYFVDAIRAWAILMMLQGHFVDGLLDVHYRDPDNAVYGIWRYFRGITAPVFFTVSGFIFTYLLIRDPKKGFENPRVKKGIRRGLELLVIGYLLRMNMFGLLQGRIYNSFYLVDVLHCIGLSIIGIIGIYLLTINRRKYLFPLSLAVITFLLFVMEPIYKQFGYTFLNEAFANYLTKENGSVFTIFPWFGYAAIGSMLSVFFIRFKNYKHLYPAAIASFTALGLALVYYSSGVFKSMYYATEIQLFNDVYVNNYLFIRLGNVFIVFALFMLLENFLKNHTLLKIGQSTLSIYVAHYVLLYGSFTGMGLYRFFKYSLPPSIIVPGALLFMLACTYAALQYEGNKVVLKSRLAEIRTLVWQRSEPYVLFTMENLKSLVARLLRVLGLVKN